MVPFGGVGNTIFVGVGGVYLANFPESSLFERRISVVKKPAGS